MKRITLSILVVAICGFYNTLNAQFDVSPNSRSVSSASGSTSFDVNAYVGWSVVEYSLWLTATKTDGTTISVSYDANTSSVPRTAKIIVSVTGGVEEVTVIQAGIVTLDVSPNSKSVSSASGSTTFAVTTSIGWSVEDNATWLTATKTDGTTISVSYDANTSSSPRTANIRAFGTGVEETVTVTQAGIATLDVSPNSKSVSSASGSTNFDVNSNVGWSVEDNATWLTATNTDGTTISVSYDTNTSSSPRTANIRAYGAGVEETVTITQDGIYLNVSPDSMDVGSDPDSTLYIVKSNVEWTVIEEVEWLSDSIFNDTLLVIYYEENLSVEDRYADIIVGWTGGDIVDSVVTLSQAGAIPHLVVTPDSLSVSSDSDFESFKVKSNIDWSVSEDSDWLSAFKANDTTLTVTFDENTGVDIRYANLNISGLEVTSQTVTIEQLGVVVPNSIADLFDNKMIIVYPNPTQNKLYVKSNADISSEIIISLYDPSGRLLYSRNVASLMSDEATVVDISALSTGVYILQLENSNSFMTRKIIKE